MLSLDQIARIQSDAAAHALDMPPIYYRMTPEQLQRVANGIGSESMGQAARDFVDTLLGRFLAPSAGHDIRYTYAIGTDADWHDANRQFRANCERMLTGGTSWWQVFKRRALRKEADGLFDAVESPAGRSAYYAAFQVGAPEIGVPNA